MKDADVLIASGIFVACFLVIVALALRARKVTRRRTVLVVTPAVWSPCNAHRPHVLRLGADHRHWECARAGCQQRWDLDQPKTTTQPYDQELDLRNDDWRAWRGEVSA